MKYEYYDGRECVTNGKRTIKCAECGSLNLSAKLTKSTIIGERKTICTECYFKDLNGELK